MDLPLWIGKYHWIEFLLKISLGLGPWHSPFILILVPLTTGTCLGHYGIPAGKFTKEFNAKSKEEGFEDQTTVQCHMRVYSDFTFDFKVHEPDTSYYLLQGKKGPDKTGYFHRFKGVEPDHILTPQMIYEVAKLKYSHYQARKGNPMPFDVFLKTMIHGIRSCGFHVSYLDYDPHKDPYINEHQRRDLIERYERKLKPIVHVEREESSAEEGGKKAKK